ncbi:cell division protein FtsB [Buchnera aphidicola (Aphis craccivora)]|uniref:Cell division protein FtsB n=1 Tax=Buchnera aphidicola (Aphis craccivora) TaxID=466616 RepID=A0A4D6XNG3_9GAMM|nr:septum formation initiator family protein [Buchnera aphidicola]QCI16654.1 cell division protein FtsB [Buchnera aphidicola (Aphis craccivora)]QLL40786.1 cell division protein FtsB [Buchnera aphidicola (Aphis craccivore)]WAI17626.1 MAG: septum formation initiator family protein [Buchnera aphidicola (Aphis craccivora)]
MGILKVFLFLLFFWLQYSLWVGKNGILDYIKIYKKIIIQKKINQDLEIKNNKLLLEIQELNNKIKD